ncbi:MAG: LamG domain-containing protein [Azoarcus sp.]|jgi:hypothetical protein|nr:LamG domain-containing protein [Azoarcus sp.]
MSHTTVLLLHFDGADGSTDIKDETGKPIMAVGAAKLSSAQSMYNGTSLALDGASAVAPPASRIEHTFGTGGATIEMFVMFNTPPTESGVVYSLWRSATANTLNFNIFEGRLRFGVSDAGVAVSDALEWETGRWYHLAASRYLAGEPGSTNCFYVFRDGVLLSPPGFSASSSSGVSSPAYASSPIIGENISGYIDELRVTTEGLYTSDFLPPAHRFFYSRMKMPLLLRFDGEDGDVNIKDEAGKSVGLSGTAALSSAQSRFGATSLYLAGGTADMAWVPPDTSLNLVDGDFTVECWVYPTLLSSTARYLFNKDGVTGQAHPQYAIYATNTVTMLYIGDSRGAVSYQQVSCPPLTVGVWQHVAMVRKGSALFLLVNGGVVGSAVQTITMADTSRLFCVGGEQPLNSGTRFAGYMSELCITREAKYVGGGVEDFPVPTAAFDSNDPHWSNTVLLAHFDGANGGTVFPDSGPLGLAMTRVGSATTSTAVATTIGGAFLNCPGGANYINIADNGAFAFGTGDFTIEMWLYIPAAGYQGAFLDTRPNSTQGSYIWFALNSSTRQFMLSVNNTTILSTAQNIFTLNKWVFVVLQRRAGTLTIVVDGVVKGLVQNNTNFLSPSTGAKLGYNSFGGSGGDNFNGYIDEVRVTKGVARYVDTSGGGVFSAVPINFDGEPTEPVTLLLRCDGVEGQRAVLDETGYCINSVGSGSSGFVTTTFARSRNGRSSLQMSNYGPWVQPRASDAAGAVFFYLGGANFTIEFWVNLARNDALTVIFEGRYSADGERITIGVSAAGTLWVYRNLVYVIAGDTKLELGAWYHVALVRYADGLRLYLNGEQEGNTHPAKGEFYMEERILIGSGTSGLSYNLQGQLDDLCVSRGIARYIPDEIPSLVLEAPFPADSTDPYWSNVTLLARLDGVAGSTIFTEETGKPIAVVGAGVSVSAAQSPFGGTSAYFTGAGSLIVPYSAALNLSTDDFTVECWFYSTTMSDTSAYTPMLVQKGGVYGVYPQFSIFLYTSGKLALQYGIEGGTAWGQTLTAATTVTLNTWHHVALVRVGTRWRLFLDGALEIEATQTGTVTDAGNKALSIGGRDVVTGNNAGSLFKGYISNVRVTKGVARYPAKTSDITVPDAPHLLQGQTRTRISGTVLDAGGTVTARHLRLHRRDTGQLVMSTVSDPETGYYEFLDPPPLEFYVIAVDDTGQFNSLIADRVVRG